MNLDIKGISNKQEILLVGAGQLGSRYLQGFSFSNIPLDIHVTDPVEQALLQANERWGDIVQDKDIAHVVSFSADLDNMLNHVAIAVIATTSDLRTEIVSQISLQTQVDYWILEKVLCQSSEEADCLLDLTVSCKGAWVNTPRQSMPLYNLIRNEFSLASPIQMHVAGGNWGLACNAVHFLELLSWLAGETVTTIETDGLDHYWFNSKRPGFFEVNGILKAHYSNGSSLTLECLNNNEPLIITITDSKKTVIVDESKCLATDDKGNKVTGAMKYQSELSGPLVESILTNGTCSLPTLQDSAITHRFYLNAMLEHYRHSMDSSATRLPVT